MSETTPIVLLLHGLGGNNKSPNMRLLSKDSYIRGYRSCVYNRRGHGYMSLQPTEFNKDTMKIFPRHCDLDDMTHVVKHVKARYPKAPLFMIGVSCGANLGVNFLAEDHKSFKAVVSVSNGYDIELASRGLTTTTNGIVCRYLKDLFYEGRLCELQALARKARIDIDIQKVMGSRTIGELDKELALPVYGYGSLSEYWRHESCRDNLHKIRTPLLCIANRSDPLLGNEVIEIAIDAAKNNDNITTVVTEYGGHIGWIEEFGKTHWHSRVIWEYFDLILTKTC